MRNFVLLLLSLLLLQSCESKEDESSRITLDKYSRKLSAMTDDVAASRTEESRQSKLSLNSYFKSEIEKLEAFKNDIQFETISEIYTVDRNHLTNISLSLIDYLNIRRELIPYYTRSVELSKNLTDSRSWLYAHQQGAVFYGVNTPKYLIPSKKEMVEKYSAECKAYESSLNANLAAAQKKENMLDEVVELVNTFVVKYNSDVSQTKLIDSLRISPLLIDIESDWLLSGMETIRDLE